MTDPRPVHVVIHGDGGGRCARRRSWGGMASISALRATPMKLATPLESHERHPVRCRRERRVEVDDDRRRRHRRRHDLRFDRRPARGVELATDPEHQ